MPITLLTGLPGHGKSLEAVRMMRDDYKDRKIYAANFEGLAYDFLGVEEFDPLKWTECESGSILFIDEAWEYFEARGPQKMPPDVIKELARHRHYGLDIVLICQGPFQLDAHVRALVETHLHVIRPFGMRYSIIRKFRGVEARPDDRQARKRGADTSTRRKFDKTLFDYYKSAEVHTIKRKIPFKLIGSIVIFAGLGIAIAHLVWFAFDWLDRDKSDALVPRNLDSFSTGAGSTAAAGLSPVEAFQAQQGSYLMGFQPVVEGAPWTASIWRDVQEPVTFPRPRCMLVEESHMCICHSQQAVRLDVGYDLCAYIARHGWFDPTVEDEIIEEQARDRMAEVIKEFRYNQEQRLKEKELRRSRFTPPAQVQ